ncbi:membrane peptidoglycan carboxypeptidase [Motilibacter peucedani]|uniref:Membrane peptidoglycan carboxypeptidase n=2 Tax=Motilibacter peucedani TaxID=598650 RepID=A0A420XU75_9ACTN|nr:membrane peptidoglycan carboxypeptidase [Motilibacter peucedani]
MPWKLLPSWRQVLLLGVLGAAMLVGAFFVAYARTTVPSADAAAVAQTSTVYYSDGKTLMGKISGGTNRTMIPDIDTIPVVLRQAVMAAEDRDFQTNSGVSPKGIVRAFWTNIKGDSKSQGGSTITQQFVRNYYADVGQQKTYQRKIHEAILAIKINKQKSKDEILRDYLNTIWWGRRSNGLQAAAQAWFPRGLNDYKSLNLSQSAFLAGVIQAPDTFDYRRHEGAVDAGKRAKAEKRFRYVLSGMVQKGWITQQQADAAKLPQLVVRDDLVTNYSDSPTGYLLKFVRDELTNWGFTEQEVEGGGLRIITTFDHDAQVAAETAMDPDKGQFPKTDAEDVHAGLASIDVKTGAVIAMYGGKNYLERQINDATQPVLPGSTFKPFALAAAIEDGHSIFSRYYGNSPLPATGTRNEFGDDYGSRVSLLTGLEKSINTVYVDAAMDIGPEKVVHALTDAGVPADAPGLAAVPSVPLGTANVSPLNMALAYSSFAGQGVRVKKPHSVARVLYRDSRDPWKPPGNPTVKAFPKDVTADVTYALSQVVDAPGGTGTEARAVPGAVAGKTGTHGQDDNTLSAWFVGFSPRIATAVDFYKGNGREDLDGVGGDTHAAFFGGGFPAQIWTAYMKAAVQLKPWKTSDDFPERVCKNCNGQDTSNDSTPAPTSSPSSSPSTSATPVRPTPTPTPTPSQPATSEAPVEPAPDGSGAPAAPAAPQPGASG